MELALFLSSWLAFFLSPALAPLALRCGLSACLRFSPRAALALSSLAAAAGYTAALLRRGLRRAVPPGQRGAAALCAVLGGVPGRMLMLMFTARFSGSLSLARAQALPLLALAIAAALPRRFLLPRVFRIPLFLLCAIIDGFFGCGGGVLLLLFSSGGVRRRHNALPGAALLLGMLSHMGALLLTAFSGAAQVFPGRTLLFLSAGAAWGSFCFEKQKKRAAAAKGLRIALLIYTLFAALSGAEQAFLAG